MDSPHYENGAMKNYCEEQRKKNLEDSKFAYDEVQILLENGT